MMSKTVMDNKAMESIPEETLSVINNVSRLLAPYFKFGYYDIDDIKQEIRLFCLEALPRYNPELASLQTFLIIHSKNRLITLKRDKFKRLNSPCVSCKHNVDYSCELHTNTSCCKPFIKWQNASKTKHSLIKMSTINDIENPPTYTPDFVEDLHNKQLTSYIDEHIPTKYREDYLKYIQGGKLHRYAKNNIEKTIKDLAKDYLISPDRI